jgi:hypothetical protein
MERVLPMKRSHFHAYRREDTARSEAALLSVWPRLADFHEDLVLIGGLVPRYLCPPVNEGFEARTLDVDFAMALAAGGTIYEPLSQRLLSEGFVSNGGRFEKAFAGGTLYLDFLTERLSASAPGAALVDDVTMSAFFGIDRALKVFREVRIEGIDLSGASARETVKVCEIGPFLCLKLQAYAQRAEPKDVFDAIHAVLAYDLGVAAAVEGFQREAGANLAYPAATQALAERFSREGEPGPAAYARFCCDGLTFPTEEDERFRRSQFAADAVTAARRLLG